MANIHPFKAWKPSPEKIKEISSVPYDVVSVEEARELADGKPDSFLHVVRPEIDLPEGTPFNDERVYRKGAENLGRLLDGETFMQEDQPAIYVYRLSTGRFRQTGIFTCVSVEDYDNDVILKHERTRPDKEDDRTRHILEQQAHAEPVMIAYRDDPTLETLTNSITGEDSLFDFSAEDGVRHTVWRVSDTTPFEELFREIERLYIADGHHRCKSASRAAEEMRSRNPDHTGEEEYNFFPAVLFPAGEMNILAYNRVVHEIPGSFFEDLGREFDLREGADPMPPEKGTVSLYMEGSWYGLDLPMRENAGSVEKLDVHRLQHYILEPYLDITDQRTSDNISFVGGSRGTEELEKLVNSGKAKLAISMYPTGIEELMEVSDEGKLMPPKSTWFEPKLRSGLLVHTF